MIEAKEKQIGNTIYKVRQLGALTGRGVFIRLVKLAGGAFGQAVTGNLAAAISSAVKDLSEEDFAYLCDVFVPQTSFRESGKPAMELSGEGLFDLHFAGRYREMVEWLYFCIDVNFGSAFRGLVSAVAARDPEKATEPVQSAS